MATPKRVFVSFAMEDSYARDFLVGQARNNRTPFEFIDMSIKAPFDESWKTQCRSRIRGCDGVIVLLSRNTGRATGARWEVWCARDEQVPVIGVYVSKDDRPAAPPELAGVKVIEWTWDGISRFIDNL
jgi:hypothetical protein